MESTGNHATKYHRSDLQRVKSDLMHLFLVPHVDHPMDFYSKAFPRQ
jgi:hypothetical protein